MNEEQIAQQAAAFIGWWQKCVFRETYEWRAGFDHWARGKGLNPADYDAILDVVKAELVLAQTEPPGL